MPFALNLNVDIAGPIVSRLPFAGSLNSIFVTASAEALTTSFISVLLAGEVSSPAGIPPDDPRPFTPHLTLARVREALRREVRILAREMTATRWPAVASPVNHVSLMRSVLSPRGPDYDELARLVLGSTG